MLEPVLEVDSQGFSLHYKTSDFVNIISLCVEVKCFQLLDLMYKNLDTKFLSLDQIIVLLKVGKTLNRFLPSLAGYRAAVQNELVNRGLTPLIISSVLKDSL